MEITITPISPEGCGDWHDRPLRYKVSGPGTETQKFCTKADSKRYASIRKRSADQTTAINTFSRS